MAETMDTTEGTKEEALINAGFRKRTNNENADAYKIFSILYGLAWKHNFVWAHHKPYSSLVVFISGVAFSISHAIVSKEEAEIIKPWAEIYFTYLYWVSIIWIMFCIIDIIHHRHKVIIPTSTLNRLVPSHMGLTGGDVRFAQNKCISTLSTANRKSSSTPYLNLQSLDECTKDQLDGHDNERGEITSNRQSIDTNNMFNFRDHHAKSNSMDNLLRQSSTTKSITDTTRDVLNRRRALDPIEEHDLITYVRHRRDSIVQHVIGYNYDDDSIVGGLYTRVGIGIFCLGTVIHSGLSILSNLENRSCARWTALMDDFSRLLFSFSQFFFIFKHSNLIIRAHESVARLAVIHIVVTNLCVWFRMVVIETKSQIMEMDSDEMAVVQHSHTASYFHNGTGGSLNLLYRLLINPSKCSTLLTNVIPATTFIHDGFVKLEPFLYPCTIEFSLMCLTLFFLIWENIGKTFTNKISDKASTKNVFMVNCHASIKGLFGGMIVFSCTMISVILYAVFRNKTSDIIQLTPSSVIAATHGPKRKDDSIAFLEIVNLCLLALSLGATVWSLIKIRKLKYRRTTTRFDDVLIIVSLAGIYLYSVFSAFAIIGNLGSSTWIIYVKVAVIILEFIEGTVHALFILIALRKRLKRTSKYNYPAREMITLLITLDLSLWFEKTTTTTKHQANPFQLAFYHVIPWSIIGAISTPLQIFFRFHASVCLSHVWANMYHMPAYVAVIPRD